MKTVAIIQARMGSTRLPGKVMMDLAGMPVLGWVVRAAKAAHLVNEVWVATPDPEIHCWAISHDVNGFLGDESDVLSRFVAIAERTHPDVVVRLTADCPFLDPWLIDACVVNAPCATTTFWPDGMDVQTFHPIHMEGGDREHVVNWEIPEMRMNGLYMRKVRLTLDTQADLDHLRSVALLLPKDRPPTWRETLNAHALSAKQAAA